MDYRLYRLRNNPDILCAIPIDLELAPPASEDTWDLIGEITPDVVPPRGFDPEVASFAFTFQGYYVFRQHPKGRPT